MSKTALVHPSTAKLKPEEQKKGVYFYTPFEVQAHLRGEVLSDEDLAIVRNFYEGIGQTVPVGGEPALAEPPVICWSCIQKDDRYEHTCKPKLAEPRRVSEPAFDAPYGKPPAKTLRKKVAPPVFNDPLNSLRKIADLAVSSLPDAAAYQLLQTLATRFEMEIE